MSSKSKSKKNAGQKSGASATPPDMMEKVNLLLADLTTPETGVTFNTASRATAASIQKQIKPPEATWTWGNDAARKSQSVSAVDVSKYGFQEDSNTLYQLTAVAPVTWKLIQAFTGTTWNWANATARNAQRVMDGDVGKIGVQTDINTFYQLANAAPKMWQEVPNPTNTSPPFELSTGASDADSYHDFFRLQIAFEDVWSELMDYRITNLGKQLYAQWNALMDQTRDDSGQSDRAKLFSPELNGGISGADELTSFLANLKIQLGISPSNPPNTNAPSTIKDELNKLQVDVLELGALAQVSDDQAVKDTSTSITNDFNTLSSSLAFLRPPSGTPLSPEVTFPDLANTLKTLETMLKENYRFDVFAPASINYGVLLNYRQHWRPQSYQVGNLVTTIALAPQETRRYTTKTVIKKSRTVKEIDDSLRSGKDESSNTWRVDAEIVDRAKNQTNFQKNASGSYGNDNAYKVSAGMQQGKDQAVESAQTKREFHESVTKSAQEYRNEHRMEITTEESREDETTTYREIRNPNDELTVTYLFYELQRRYLVDEELHKATPVILVANEVPAPHEIDEAWILRYDWIIKRAILDDSFLAALEYLASNYTGAELALQTLGLAVEQQKLLVEKISKQVELANDALNATTLGLEGTEDQLVQNQKQTENMAFVKSFFDPLGITQTGNRDGNSDRSRVDFAKDALNRAQAKANQLTGDLKTETTALQAAIDKYTSAVTKHFSMLAEIDRLRLHVKDNIIHYMQAIWTYEPSDQRYFRLYNLDVPVFDHNTTVNASQKMGMEQVDLTHQALKVLFPAPTLRKEPTKLHQVADLENLIGFKGNYMIFPMVNFNYMTWFMLQDYIHIDTTTGVTAQDPDPHANLTIPELQKVMDSIKTGNPASFAGLQDSFQEIVFRLLSKQDPEMVIVPSNSLYIEALPGTHPLLEDFKLIHRAIDIKKAQAEARKAELENLRLSARLANAQYEDPDIEKKVIVEAGSNGHVSVEAEG